MCAYMRYLCRQYTHRNTHEANSHTPHTHTCIHTHMRRLGPQNSKHIHTHKKHKHIHTQAQCSTPLGGQEIQTQIQVNLRQKREQTLAERSCVLLKTSSSVWRTSLLCYRVPSSSYPETRAEISYRVMTRTQEVCLTLPRQISRQMAPGRICRMFR
jgi:hypothetical protein